MNSPSVGGIATAISPICSGSTTTITLTAYTGTIQWQQSLDGLTSWANVIGGSGATGTIYTTPALSTTTFYRAIVTNGACTFATSVLDTVIVNTASVGGTATAISPICSGNTSTITLSGNSGTIQWQQSPNGISSWTNVIGGSGANSITYSTPTLSSTTYYRATVTNGVCASAFSVSDTIVVNALSVGGTATANSPICSGSTSTITLSANTGTIQWQQSPDGINSWANVTGGSGATTSIYTTPALFTSTYYRAIVANGVCSSAISVIDTVVVNATSVGGVATALSPICLGNTSSISLVGNTGNIQWQQSPDGTTSWTNVSGGSGSTSSIYITPSLINTTYYRAIVTNGVCPSTNSALDTVTVNAPSLGGIATALSPICSGNTSTVTLAGYTGTIQWQSSNDGTTSWTNVVGGNGSTTNTYSTPPLLTSTYYRAIVTNGVCPSATSILDTIVVNSLSVGGITTSTSPICSGNSSTVTLSAYTGSIQWQQSPNGTSSWINVSGGSGATAITYTTSSLSSTTFYRAIVTNGACIGVYSEIDTIIVLPVPVGGFATAISPVCIGSTSTVTLSGFTGNIQWQQSPNGSTLWNDVSGGSGANTTSYTTPSLLSLTYYRALVSNGVCPSVYSSIDTVIISPLSVGGGANAASPICAGNTTVVTLNGFTGNIQWQQSPDGTSSWTNVTGGSGANSASYTTPPLNITTFYQAVITSGACASVISSIDNVMVLSVPIGGIATSNSPVCSGSVSTISLTGYSGNIQWQQSPNGTSLWTDVTGGSGANTSTYTSPALTTLIYYRAILSNAACSANSTVDTVLIDAQSLGGIATTISPVCEGFSSSVSLTGYTGNIQWQQSPDGTSSWVNVIGGSGVTNSTYQTAPLNVITYYRAIVTNGACSSANSNSDSIMVNPISVGGVANAVSPICSGNTSTISLSGFSGTIQWQQSPNNTTSWTNVSGGSGANNSTYTTPILTTTTYFRAIITSGVCPSDSSISDTLLVNPLPVVSFTIPLQHDTVCFEEPAFILTGGNPLNGTYSGTGVSSGSFDPAIAGIGTHILTYAYTNPATTCSASATQTIEEISCIGIKEIEKSQISIYPNPFEDELFFNISSSKNVEVELFNSIGKLIKSLTLFDNLSENYCIKMCSYSQGFYYLKFHFKDEVKTYKILKIK